MRLIRFSRHHAQPIQLFQVPLAGGIIGEYPTGFGPLFLVMEGAVGRPVRMESE